MPDMRLLRRAVPGLRLLVITLLVLAGAVGPGAGQTGPAASGRAVVLTLEGAVTPASADYLVRGIAEAGAEGASLVVIRMDTPGGLDTSMREIVRAILASPVPVAGWVAPGGARAASAGTYILYASHVAAMAPGTNIGAATPVQLGGGGSPFGRAEEEDGGDGEDLAPGTASEAKAINDAVAYIRGLATLRGRNADWAERAVRRAESLGAMEAAEIGAIDFVASNMEALLEGADGREVEAGGRTVTLATAGLEVEERPPGLKTRLLSVLTDPNVALILMMVGIYGIIFEFINPGAIFPGVIGAISLLTGFYALSVLPVTFAGAGLMLLGVALIVAEAFTPSFGVLGIGGAVAITLGATLLVDTDMPGLALSWPVIAALGVASLAFALLVARMAVGSRRQPVTTGREQMIGARAIVLEWQEGRGAVQVHGERWQATGEEPFVAGDEAEVVGVEGLVLRIARRERGEAARGTGPAARQLE